MKHVTAVTKHPATAAVWQDVICYSTHAIASIVEAKGGMSPFVTYLDEKCDLPDPNQGE